LRATPTKKHVILFLAANPRGTSHLALDREAHAIHLELKRSGYRHRFDFVTRWAAEPLDLRRELCELKPTVVHFSGHGGGRGLEAPGSAEARDVASSAPLHADEAGKPTRTRTALPGIARCSARQATRPSARSSTKRAPTIRMVRVSTDRMVELIEVMALNPAGQQQQIRKGGAPADRGPAIAPDRTGTARGRP